MNLKGPIYSWRKFAHNYLQALRLTQLEKEAHLRL